MADNPFGTPVAGLALEMAVRNQQLLENIPKMTENQRRLINLRLQRYGGDISQYEPFMDVGYDTTVKAMRSQAEGMRDYLVGLPELMAKAMKEGQSSGVSYRAPDILQPFDVAAAAEEARQREMQRRKDIVDAKDSFRPATVASPAATAATQRQSTQNRRLRPVRGNF